MGKIIEWVGRALGAAAGALFGGAPRKQQQASNVVNFQGRLAEQRSDSRGGWKWAMRQARDRGDTMVEDRGDVVLDYDPRKKKYVLTMGSLSEILSDAETARIVVWYDGWRRREDDSA
ncbi:MAG: hypothetical protein GWN58_58510 [Anaerolineae bacterium]|nr:hypothetical protein [Anaerolineae bacterium]